MLCRYSSVRHRHITEEIKQTIIALQAEINNAIYTVDKRPVVLKNKLEELSLSSGLEEAVEAKEGKTQAMRQVEEEVKAMEASQKLLNELLSKAQAEAVAKLQRLTPLPPR